MSSKLISKEDILSKKSTFFEIKKVDSPIEKKDKDKILPIQNEEKPLFNTIKKETIKKSPKTKVIKTISTKKKLVNYSIKMIEYLTHLPFAITTLVMGIINIIISFSALGALFIIYLLYIYPYNIIKADYVEILLVIASFAFIFLYTGFRLVVYNIMTLFTYPFEKSLFFFIVPLTLLMQYGMYFYNDCQTELTCKILDKHHYQDIDATDFNQKLSQLKIKYGETVNFYFKDIFVALDKKLKIVEKTKEIPTE
jgi:hypothetical protein